MDAAPHRAAAPPSARRPSVVAYGAVWGSVPASVAVAGFAAKLAGPRWEWIWLPIVCYAPIFAALALLRERPPYERASLAAPAGGATLLSLLALALRWFLGAPNGGVMTVIGPAVPIAVYLAGFPVWWRLGTPRSFWLGWIVVSVVSFDLIAEAALLLGAPIDP
jgi:hypothetical protein